jgi:hypothetical protein
VAGFAATYNVSTMNELQCVSETVKMDLENILACGPDAGQQPEDNQIYNSRF